MAQSCPRPHSQNDSGSNLIKYLHYCDNSKIKENEISRRVLGAKEGRQVVGRARARKRRETLWRGPGVVLGCTAWKGIIIILAILLQLPSKNESVLNRSRFRVQHHNGRGSTSPTRLNGMTVRRTDGRLTITEATWARVLQITRTHRGSIGDVKKASS